MSGVVLRQLIWKDCFLVRTQMLVSLLGGGVALLLFWVGGDPLGMIGIVSFFVALVVFGSMMPMASIIAERKKQNLAFAMSLPVSSFQYTVAKFVSTIGMYLVLWLVLLGAGIAAILSRADVPNGVIPLTVILAMFPLVGFSLITGTALVSESEAWAVASTIVCNSTYGLTWYFIFTRVPGVMKDVGAAAPVWSSTALTFLGVQAGVIAVVLGLTLFLQSRKRDFV